MHSFRYYNNIIQFYRPTLEVHETILNLGTLQHESVFTLAFCSLSKQVVAD